MDELWLTKIELNPKSRAVWRDLGNAQELHKTISGAFDVIDNEPGLEEHEKLKPRCKNRLLHRVEIERRGETASLLLQSICEPKWSHLPDGYALSIETKSVSDVYQRVAAGTELRFRLHANPTKRVSNSDGRADARFKQTQAPGEYKRLHGKNETRRRVEIMGDDKKSREEKLIEWLARKGAGDELKKIPPGGFRLVDVSVRDRQAIPNVAASFSGGQKFKKHRGDEHRVSLDGVTFDGVLEVTDADKFREALRNGIGSGKAYGFGLMSVARAVGGTAA